VGRVLRIFLALVIAAVVVGGGAYLAAGAVVYDQISKVTAHCGGRFAGVTPANLAYDGDEAKLLSTVDLAAYRMPQYQEVAFPARDEPAVTIRGWYVPAASDAATAPTVILVHGRDSCRKDWNVMVPAGMLHRAGFSVLLLDQRNHGESTVTTGRYAGGMREYRDVLGAWDWLAQQGVAASRIGLFGASLGAAATLIAAGQEPRIPAVWDDSSYADTETRIKEDLAQRGYPTILSAAGGLMAQLIGGDDIYSTGPLTAVRNMGGRQLFIAHGEDDQTTLVHHAHDLAAAAKAAGVHVETWIVPKADHTRELAMVPAEYEARLVAFFRAALH